MSEPKTPLPWISRSVHEIVDDAGIVRAVFRATPDRDYAVHAANALPELTAALRRCGDALLRVAASDAMDRTVLMTYAMSEAEQVRAALAKAEGGGG